MANIIKKIHNMGVLMITQPTQKSRLGYGGQQDQQCPVNPSVGALQKNRPKRTLLSQTFRKLGQQGI